MHVNGKFQSHMIHVGLDHDFFHIYIITYSQTIFTAELTIKALKTFSCIENFARIILPNNWWAFKFSKKYFFNWFCLLDWRKQIFRQLSFRRRTNRLKTESSGMAKFCLAFAQWKRDLYVCAGARLWDG